MRLKVFIIGHGRHASEVANYLKEEKSFVNAGYVVDDEYYNEQIQDSLPLSKFIKIYLGKNVRLISAIASTNRRIIIEQLESIGFKFINIIHKSSYFNNQTKIGTGNCIAPLSIVNANCSIGNHCIINSNTNISHDCTIGNFVTISPSVTLTGGVHINDGVFIGAGATILPNLTIGKNAIIGAGACVTANVLNDTTVIGVPAKPL